MPDHVTVAVDAGGADLGPAEVAAGAAIAAERGVRVLLFGDASRIDSVPAGVEVVDAPLSIAKEADPARAVRGNPESSIVQAVRAVADGRADAFVSGGSTGAALAAGLFTLKRGRGIHRPALALPIPVPGAPVTLLDVGANVEVRDDHLVQFAFMGAAFAQTVLGVERPRVALLSNGEEPTKGTETVVAAHAEIARRAQGSPLFEFVGNVEGTDLVTGAADVVVTDGFTGNVALKLVEGVSQMMIGAIRDVATSTPRAKAGGLLLRPALRGFRDEIDPEGPGGAYLLGLRRLGVVPHGRFTRFGFSQAILLAARGVSGDVVGRTHGALQTAGALRARPGAAGGESPQRAGSSGDDSAPSDSSSTVSAP
ncbi:phosphate acyltransferase PlsX [Paraconexibacter algicola]|uniref:Phosphate acyltransferase n=1 Tax=Paraconexibacter algicola TaxID=2133960 RepID=A0A2T4UD32_9ACTN|nr:phosphate acyltransferase PlsX [Paraconexibacter algicola]PTL55410.1 phosphate acyltransferase PlsX [Paraconexibacter algicola]